MWYYKINTYKNISRQVTYVQNIIIIPIETMTKSDSSMGEGTTTSTIQIHNHTDES